jgi:hypothetical protein
LSKNGLAILKKKMDKNSAPKADMTRLHDAFLDSMTDSVSRMGDMADARSNQWRSVVVEIRAGTDVEVLYPKVPLVDIDGLQVFDLLFQSASKAVKSVSASFYDSDEAIDRWLSLCKASKDPTHSRRVRMIGVIMHKIMQAQGWAYVPYNDSWRSPGWLFPPIMIKQETIFALANESGA